MELVQCIKDEYDHVLVKDEEIENRWQRYFYKLFNEGMFHDLELGKLNDSERPTKL